MQKSLPIDCFRTRNKTKAFGLKTISNAALTFLLFWIAFAFLSSNDVYGAVFTSNASGNWNVGGTWLGGTAPSSGDDVIIRPGDNVTVTVSTSINSITFNNTALTTGIVTVNSGITLTVATSI